MSTVGKQTAMIVVFTIILLPSPFCLSAPGSPDEGQTATGIDSQAEAVLGRWSRSISTATTIQAEITSTFRVSLGNSSTLIPPKISKYQFFLQGPNCVAMVLEKGDGLTLVSDGKMVHSWRPVLQEYSSRKLGRNLASHFTDPDYGVLLFPALVSGKPAHVLTSELDQIRYLGMEEIDGARSHHLRGSNKAFPIDVWITCDEPLRIVKAVIDMSGALGGGSPQDGGLTTPSRSSMVREYEFSNWRYNQLLPEDRFSFEVPEGARTPEPVQSAEGSEHPLMGKPAPVFMLELLEGGKLDLASHLGRDVIVLDFFATWCRPCRMAMPQIAETVEPLRDQGAVFYAVDLREGRERVSEFLKKEDLQIPMALDSEGKVGDLYGVRLIPQTVIIGRDGKVRFVHFGSPTDLRQRLNNELKGLLAEARMEQQSASE